MTRSETFFFGEFFDSAHNDWAPCAMITGTRPGKDTEQEALDDITEFKELGTFYATRKFRLRKFTQIEEIREVEN